MIVVISLNHVFTYALHVFTSTSTYISASNNVNNAIVVAYLNASIFCQL
jgi:hypothetical protein